MVQTMQTLTLSWPATAGGPRRWHSKKPQTTKEDRKNAGKRGLTTQHSAAKGPLHTTQHSAGGGEVEGKGQMRPHRPAIRSIQLEGAYLHQN